jgi:hypothetical protein
MKKALPIILITFLVTASLAWLIWWNLKTIYIPSITDTAIYKAQQDSLKRYRSVDDTLQVYRMALAEKDRVLTARRHTEKVKDSARLDSVKSLPQSQQVAFFALKTNTDSITTLPDSTALIRPKTLQNANILIQEGENAIKDIGRLEIINKVKDQRIQNDSLIIDNKVGENKVLENQNTSLVSDNKAKDGIIKNKDKTIRKEKIAKILIVTGSVAIEIITIALFLI